LTKICEDRMVLYTVIIDEWIQVEPRRRQDETKLNRMQNLLVCVCVDSRRLSENEVYEKSEGFI
jgi:hypothetical protein